MQNKLPPSLTVEAVMDAAAQDSNTGFCIACGAQHDGVEPDASGYKCGVCGEMKVMGAEILLISFL